MSYLNGKQTFRCLTCPENSHWRYEYDEEGSKV